MRINHYYYTEMISIDDIRNKENWDFQNRKIEASIIAGLNSNYYKCNEYGISESEWFSLMMMVGEGSRLVQGFGETKDEKSLSEFCSYNFAKLLNKVPKTQFNRVYRMETNYQLSDFHNLYKNGTPFIPKGYYTASRDLFRDDSLVMIEIEVDPRKTKAHDLFRVYNLGEEYQVNKFTIQRIEENKVFLKELE